MLATMKSSAAYIQSPRPIVAISSVATTPTTHEDGEQPLLDARDSRRSRRGSGPSSATIVTAIVVAQANRAVASAGGSPAAA